MEILPVLVLCGAGLLAFRYKTEVLNLLYGKSLLGLEAISDKNELFIGRRLGGLLKYQFCTTKGLDQELIET
jgi:hypothetical protein